MAHSVEMTVSFYHGVHPGNARTVGFRYCPLCGEDIDVGGEGPWVTPCEHVMFCYDYGPEPGFFNVHESVAQVVDKAPNLMDMDDEEFEAASADGQCETNWVIERIESDSIVFFRINPQRGQDAYPAGIAFDFGAEIKE